MWPDTRRETRRLHVSRRFPAWTRQPLQTYVAAALLCALLPTALRAQTNAITVAYHQGQAPVAPDAIATLGPGLFGDSMNLYNGSFAFEQTDVELPGNSALPVAVVRQFAPRLWTVRGAMADWDLNTPRIQGTFAYPEGWVPRCSGFNMPPTVTRGLSIPTYSLTGQPQPVGGSSVTGTRPATKAVPAAASSAADFQPWEYWGGTNLVVPGQGSQEILTRASGNTFAPTDGGSYPLVTAKNWQIGCLATVQNASGEGFVALSPDGVRYRFDWMATRAQTAMRKGDALLTRRDHFLMATEC